MTSEIRYRRCGFRRCEGSLTFGRGTGLMVLAQLCERVVSGYDIIMKIVYLTDIGFFADLKLTVPISGVLIFCTMFPPSGQQDDHDRRYAPNRQYTGLYHFCIRIYPSKDNPSACTLQKTHCPVSAQPISPSVFAHCANIKIEYPWLLQHEYSILVRVARLELTAS